MTFKTLMCATAAALTLGSLTSAPSLAQNNGLLGQIVTYGFNFCPSGSIAADGQLLNINDYRLLFSLYGVTFGGDGRRTFGVPDLRNRLAVGAGNGRGLTNRRLGQQIGARTVTLTTDQLPSHNHSLGATTNPPASADPSGRVLVAFAGVPAYATAGSNDVTMNTGTIAETGDGQAMSLQSPVLGMIMCINTAGTFPTRN